MGCRALQLYTAVTALHLYTLYTLYTLHPSTPILWTREYWRPRQSLSRPSDSPALGISQSSKTRWATQALTREPVFTRSFDIFTAEQPPGVCGRSTKSVSIFAFSAEYAAFRDCTDRIHQFTHSTDQSRTEGARDSLARGRQGA